MNVTIEFMAFIKRPQDIPRTFDYELKEPTTIQELLLMLGFDKKELNLMQFFISQNGGKQSSQRKRSKYLLRDEDHLFVTIPVGGG